MSFQTKPKLFTRLVWAPLAAIAFAFAPQREVEVRVVDGPNDECFGAPLLWQCDSVFSLEFIWYLGPLAINVVAYSIAAFAVAWLWRRLPVSSHRIIGGLFTLVAWVAGAGSLCLTAYTVFALGHYGGHWSDPIPPEQIVGTGWGPLFGF